MQIATRTAQLLIATALISAVVLLGAVLKGVPDSVHAPVSAAPLALAGLAYAILQIAARPDFATLLKRLLLAATFIAWGVDQMLPPGRPATILGDCVIAAYVLDLFWLMQELTAPQPAVPATPPPRPPADERA